MAKFSLIAPTFSRPDEVQEFLESLTHLKSKDFEVIIADGSPNDDVRPVCAPFLNQLPLRIIYERFLPVSDARNAAAAVATGEWLIFLDSDCIIPPEYLHHVEDFLKHHSVDLFGGPDAAHVSFSHVQKAISYSMTSVFTTGGIRGGKKHVGTFHPRGFNMGIRKSAFDAVGGYSDFRCGEDIELSIRLIKSGHKSALISDAYVYHKRRTDFQKFFKQVFRFGAARINLFRRHREELKITHCFPAAFLIYISILPIVLLLSAKLFLIQVIFLLLYLLAIAIDSTLKNRSLQVGILSVRAAIVQLCGYGYGFLRNAVEVFIFGNEKGLKL